MKKSWAWIVCLSLILTSLTGCGASGKGQAFYYDLSGNPKNLDPQLADDAASLTMLQNMMDGLLRFSQDGKLIGAAAERYEVSADQKSYTFYLRKDAVWRKDSKEAETPVTAHDFVFAFQRIFNPYTRSPYGDQFSAIVNAKEILAGTKTYESLGVSAPDDYTFVVKLVEPDPFFAQLTTLPAAFPCNRAFFDSTKGRYGLSEDDLLYNGAFYLSKWDKDKNAVLKKNQSYQASDVTPSSVSLYFANDEKQTLTRFEKGHLDAAPILSKDLNIVEQRKGTVIKEQNTSYIILVNTKDEVLSNPMIRKALALAFDRDAYTSVLPEDLISARTLIPPTVQIGDQSYRGLADKTQAKYDQKEAKQALAQGLAALGKDAMPKLSLLCPDDNPIHEQAFSYAHQHWQRDLNTFVSVQTQSLSEIYAAISSGDFQLAILPVSPAYNSPESILKWFVSTSAQNESGYANAAYDRLMTESFQTAKQAAQQYASAEQLLMDDGVVIPLYLRTTYYGLDEGVEGIRFSPFSGVLFSEALKKN